MEAVLSANFHPLFMFVLTIRILKEQVKVSEKANFGVVKVILLGL
jgi:hypothetical protein